MGVGMQRAQTRSQKMLDDSRETDSMSTQNALSIPRLTAYEIIY